MDVFGLCSVQFSSVQFVTLLKQNVLFIYYIKSYWRYNKENFKKLRTIKNDWTKHNDYFDLLTDCLQWGILVVTEFNADHIN